MPGAKTAKRTADGLDDLNTRVSPFDDDSDNAQPLAHCRPVMTPLAVAAAAAALPNVAFRDVASSFPKNAPQMMLKPMFWSLSTTTCSIAPACAGSA